MTELSARPLLGPTWQRLRFWMVLLGLVVVGAVAVVVVAASTSAPGVALDPTSPAHDGSKALAQLLRARGTSVSKLTAPADALARPAASTVLVVDPDDLGADQLRQLRGHRVVLVNPDVAALAIFTSAYQARDVVGSGPIAPGCAWPGAATGSGAGPVTFPAATMTYAGSPSCYDGAVVVTDQLVVLGSPDLLRNDQLAKNNIAALDLNAISADATVTDVAWLLPGVIDSGAGSPSVWALFPPWAQHAFWWLLVVGGLVVLWRGRRLGPVVTEPLPVVVRSAEVVEGHGRLYRKAGARDRAAELLRAATTTRLAVRLGIDPRAPAGEVAAVVSARRGAGSAPVLLGPAPTDDRALLRLAGELETLEAGTVTRHDR